MCIWCFVVAILLHLLLLRLATLSSSSSLFSCATSRRVVVVDSCVADCVCVRACLWLCVEFSAGRISSSSASAEQPPAQHQHYLFCRPRVRVRRVVVAQTVRVRIRLGFSQILRPANIAIGSVQCSSPTQRVSAMHSTCLWRHHHWSERPEFAECVCMCARMCMCVCRPRWPVRKFVILCMRFALYFCTILTYVWGSPISR